MSKFSGYGFVLLAAGLWALIGPVAKFALAENVDPLELAFWRMTSGAFFFALHARKSGSWKAKAKDAPVFIAFGVVGVALFFGSYLLAVQGAGAAIASILLYTAPAWVAVLSRICFNEAISKQKVIALSLAMGGAFLVCLAGAGGEGNVTLAGIFFGLVSGFTYSLHYVFGKKYLQEYSSVTLYVWCLPVGALAITPWVTFTVPSLTTVLVILAHGLLCTYGAYYAYCEGLRRLEATRVAVVANAEPVLAAVLAFWWWDELLSPVSYAGGLLVIAGVLLIVRDSSVTGDA